MASEDLPMEFIEGVPAPDIERIIVDALDEDLGGNYRQRETGRDVTTMATFAEDHVSTAKAVARADGVLAGVPVIPAIVNHVTTRFSHAPVEVVLHKNDGDTLSKGDIIATLTGPTRTILIVERTMLNLLSHMSGIATHTAAWVRELEGTEVQVLDTRKTTPGLRSLDKYAVRCGGGTNKRLGLYDVAMIKDNHIAACGGIAKAFAAVKAAYPDVDIQVEVGTVAEAEEAIAAGATFLLCDNMSPELLTSTVAAVAGRAELEATGGMTLAVAAEYACTGVDYISVGGLTHSSPALDIALDF